MLIPVEDGSFANLTHVVRIDPVEYKTWERGKFTGSRLTLVTGDVVCSRMSPAEIAAERGEPQKFETAPMTEFDFG